MSMKAITAYTIILVSLAVLFSSAPSVFAEEEATSIMCDNGIVNIGDMDVDVEDKCGEPETQDMNQWVYKFGPEQPVYTVIFKESKVVRILEDEWGD